MSYGLVATCDPHVIRWPTHSFPFAPLSRPSILGASEGYSCQIWRQCHEAWVHPFRRSHLTQPGGQGTAVDMKIWGGGLIPHLRGGFALKGLNKVSLLEGASLYVSLWGVIVVSATDPRLLARVPSLYDHLSRKPDSLTSDLPAWPTVYFQCDVQVRMTTSLGSLIISSSSLPSDLPARPTVYFQCVVYRE